MWSRTATEETLYPKMILSLTVDENELNSFNVSNDLELTILEYLRNKIGNDILIEIYCIEKKEGNYLVIASIHNHHKGLSKYH